MTAGAYSQLAGETSAICHDRRHLETETCRNLLLDRSDSRETAGTLRAELGQFGARELLHRHLPPSATEKLSVFARLLLDWNRGVNLVARSTVDGLWRRHILDSAQLFRFRPAGNLRWLDIGTGAGLPGMVLAVLAECDRHDHEVLLVESSARRIEFLRFVRRELDVDVQILHMRSEQCAPCHADIVTARAVADLKSLIGLVIPHLAAQGRGIFPKGRDCRSEMEQARQLWQFAWQCHASVTSRDGRIVVLQEVNRA